MIEFVAEVTNTPDHAEIRISGYLSSDSAARLDEAMKQVADANRVVLVFDEQYFTLWLQKIGSFNGTDCHIVTCGASEDRVSMLLTETRSNPLQEDTASEVQQTSCFGPFSQAP